jgi:hypothetical protein
MTAADPVDPKPAHVPAPRSVASTLPGWQTDPALLPSWICGHWTIENQLDWVRTSLLLRNTFQLFNTPAGPYTVKAPH